MTRLSSADLKNSLYLSMFLSLCLYFVFVFEFVFVFVVKILFVFVFVFLLFRIFLFLFSNDAAELYPRLIWMKYFKSRQENAFRLLFRFYKQPNHVDQTDNDDDKGRLRNPNDDFFVFKQ